MPVMVRDRLRRIRLLYRLQFLLERQFVKGASFQLLVVAAFIGLISLLGGALVLPVADDAAHLGEAVWWAFLRLSDPGYLGDDQGVWRRIVSTLLTVAGYVVFLGALVAIMTQWLNARMRQLESGLTPVATRNHIVVLGWNNRTLPVVGEIMQSEGRVKRFLARLHTSRLRLVILSGEVSRWHAQTLRDHPAIGRRAKDVVLRSGTPLVVDDLERVDCLNAAAVIIPSGSIGTGLAPDMATVKALLSLSNYPGITPERLPYVVAEIQDHRKVTVARRAYRGPLEIVSSSSLVSRLMAQNLRNQGLSRVYRELLSHHIGCGFYVREHVGPPGISLHALARRYEQAVLCGVVRWSNGRFMPHLNPPADFIVQADDRLVFVAPSYEATDALKAAPRESPVPPAAAAEQTATGSTRRILVLGWNRHVAALIHELSTYEGETFEVTIASLVGQRVREAVLAEHGGCEGISCRHLEVDYVIESDLRALQPGAFDDILLASSERLGTGEEADTRAVVAYLLLEGLLEGLDPAPHILLEMQDPDNEPLVAGRNAEVVVTPLILAHVVAQVALRRELQAVFEDLFTAGGPELVFRTPASCGLEPGSVSFAETAERLRATGNTLLGVYRVAEDSLTLSPSRGAAMSLEPDDKLVVMTTYSTSGAG